MPRFEAASISITSSEVPAAISLHESHSPQGFGVGPFTQFNAFARILAAVVFPTPRAPEKIYACATRSCLIAFFRVSVTCCWPTRSSNVWGRHLRAMTWELMEKFSVLKLLESAQRRSHQHSFGLFS